MKLRPWMPFHCGDFLKETAGLSTMAVGAYVYLLVAYWERRSLPQDDATLARIAHVRPEMWRKLKPSMMRLFDSSWSHKRLLAEALRLDKKSMENKTRAAAKVALPNRFPGPESHPNSRHPYPDKNKKEGSPDDEQALKAEIEARLEELNRSVLPFTIKGRRQ